MYNKLFLLFYALFVTICSFSCNPALRDYHSRSPAEEAINET